MSNVSMVFFHLTPVCFSALPLLASSLFPSFFTIKGENDDGAKLFEGVLVQHLMEEVRSILFQITLCFAGQGKRLLISYSEHLNFARCSNISLLDTLLWGFLKRK